MHIKVKWAMKMTKLVKDNAAFKGKQKCQLVKGVEIQKGECKGKKISTIAKTTSLETQTVEGLATSKLSVEEE